MLKVSVTHDWDVGNPSIFRISMTLVVNNFPQKESRPTIVKTIKNFFWRKQHCRSELQMHPQAQSQSTTQVVPYAMSQSHGLHQLIEQVCTHTWEARRLHTTMWHIKAKPNRHPASSSPNMRGDNTKDASNAQLHTHQSTRHWETPQPNYASLRGENKLKDCHNNLSHQP